MSHLKDVEKKKRMDDPVQFKKMMEAIVGLAKKAPSINQLIEFSGDAEENLYGVANHLYETGHYKEGIDVFDKLFMLDVSSYRYALGAAACRHQLKQYAKAIAYYMIAGINNPSNPAPSFFAAECSLELGEKESALLFFQETLQKIGDSKEFHTIKERSELLIPALKNPTQE
ncbi:MAG: SycD/LcrH family type III secretion system chaperone [Chlamydiales bacterium]|nr:SycD/LcrH family type III secretion system chaperone [Chlamydiales bacterium]